MALPYRYLTKIKAIALYIIRNLLRYIIRPKVWMESRQRRVWHQAAGTLFYTRFARFHARLRRNSIQRAGALIPYQACGLDKKSRIKMIRLFWCGRRDLNPYVGNTRPSNVRVCRFRHSRGRVVLYNIFLQMTIPFLKKTKNIVRLILLTKSM